MKNIEDKSIDMILADLPYGSTHCRWDSPINLTLLWAQYKRIIKDNGAIALTAQTPFDKVLGCSNLEWLRYEWIWEKTQPTGHLNAKKMPMKAHENILVFYKNLPTYNPIKTFGHPRKVSTAHHKRNTSTGEIYAKCDNFSDYDSTDRYPRSVQVFASDKQKMNLHSTQKPVALFEYLIRTYTNEGDIVLDNVAGSGTTGISCINLNRNYILIEKDEEFYNLILERITNHEIK
jgi:site-specific DNA-methyltransferase (adenine-specific)